MGRAHIDLLVDFRILPAAEYAAPSDAEGTVNASYCKSRLRCEFALLHSAWDRTCSGSGLLLFRRALQRLGPPSTSSILRA